jgi:hypothetical protein
MHARLWQVTPSPSCKERQLDQQRAMHSLPITYGRQNGRMQGVGRQGAGRQGAGRQGRQCKGLAGKGQAGKGQAGKGGRGKQADKGSRQGKGGICICICICPACLPTLATLAPCYISCFVLPCLALPSLLASFGAICLPLLCASPCLFALTLSCLAFALLCLAFALP